MHMRFSGGHWSSKLNRLSTRSSVLPSSIRRIECSRLVFLSTDSMHSLARSKALWTGTITV